MPSTQTGAAAPTYAGQPLGYWQDMLAQHLGKDSAADKEQCRRAAQALGQFGPAAKAAIPLLVQAIQSPSLEVRGFAVDALGRIGLEPQTVVPAILAEVDLPKDHINYAPWRRSAGWRRERSGGSVLTRRLRYRFWPRRCRTKTRCTACQPRWRCGRSPSTPRPFPRCRPC